ncbi:hypothetical protein BDV97DRAFT_282355, partial [Delphinella strobiligena]
MAPSPITEDYYMVLEVEQTAAPEVIVKSYKRLALKLHPDRNIKYNATEAFQLLGRAYETLKDEGKRQAYDLIYPSIKRSRPSTQTQQTPRPSPAPRPQAQTPNEAAQIAALQKSKQERQVQWWIKKTTFDSSIFEKQRDVRRVEQEIKNLDSIVAAEKATEAQKNSWGTWCLSPIYKKVEDSEDEKARKDRERQERRIEKDMKERRLVSHKAELTKVESLLRKAREEVDTANMVDDRKIRVLQDKIWTRETQERQEREKVERERLAKLWQQQQEQRERQAREHAEILAKERAEKRAAEQKQYEAQSRARQKIFDDEIKKRSPEQYAYSNLSESRSRQGHPSTCRHDGWWPKV